MGDKINRVPTGIPGLDTMLEGGIPEGYTVLVAGGPGSGKSTLAMQFIYNGVVKYGETGVYATLQENPDEMKTNFSRFGWNLGKVDILGLIPQKAGELEDDYVLPARYDRAEEDLGFEWFSIEQVKKIIAERVRKKGAKRIVIDSLAPLIYQIENSFNIRQEVLDLVSLLKKLGCTTMLITEMPEGQKGVSTFSVEEFMSQGIIVIYNIPKGSDRVRGLEILKMRATDHSKKICLMDIEKNGIVVYPNEDLHREM